MRILLLALAAFGLTACATTETGTGQPAHGWTQIEISEGACFGTCPIYSISLTPDDRYELNGERFTRTSGRSTGALQAGSFERIAAILLNHDVASIPADITMNNPAACGRSMMSDMPDFRLRMTGDAGQQSIAWYPGCADSPWRGAMSEIQTEVRAVYGYASLVAPKR